MRDNSRKSAKNMKYIILFLLPVTILLLAFFVYPIFSILVLSFTEWNGIEPITFVGISNFSELFSDSVFRTSIVNNLVWALSAALLQIPLASVMALILAREVKGWKTFRTLFFLPNVISLVALAMLWKAMYNPEFGVINNFLSIIGLEHIARNWLGELNSALPAVIFSYQIYIGYFMVIILAGAMAIPKSLYEAAQIDGANVLQQEIHITLPAIRGVLVTAGTLAVAYALRQFETTFLMTAGGPANKTPVMGLYMYRQMAGFHYGTAAATGILMIVLGVLVTTSLQRLFGKTDVAADSIQ
jgi:raffinose/stachyose/melibiose transport system permease protein